ncbi:MAG: LON peptidase substrate-binding domain-containing protein, partial [Pseudobdellovibrionaceae bacterium]
MLSSFGTPTSSRRLPILPLRDIVVFPHMIVPLFVGREKSVHALEKVMKDEKKIILLTQKSPNVDDPQGDDLYEIGVEGSILQLLKLPDGTVKVLVEGLHRISVTDINEREDGYLVGDCEALDDGSTWNDELQALARAALTQFEQYVKLNKKIPPEVIVSLQQISEPTKLADTIASHLVLKIEDKQKILEAGNTEDRLELIYSF